jgi:predicted glycosyl hydrolase (DUF1957 family)|tara:strand:+ start:246 stop:443 length:198 start_codon:yes stop_codon:yes gene_type:complete
MTKTKFLDQELALDDLQMINGGWSWGVFRAWKRWINDEADDVVNALDRLNDYAKNNTSYDHMAEG